MFDESLLYMFAARESAFGIKSVQEDKTREAWNQLLDIKDVLECDSKMYGSPSQEELRGLYNQLTLIAKELKDGTKKEENQGSQKVHCGTKGQD